MDFSDWLERERNLMGFNVSKIDKNSRHILENTVKISNTKDQDSRSAIMLESEKGTIMKYNWKEVSSIMIDGSTDSLNLLHSTKTVPPVHTFEVRSTRNDGTTEVDHFTITTKTGMEMGNNSLDILLSDLGLDVNEKPNEILAMPPEMEWFVSSTELTADGGTKVTFIKNKAMNVEIKMGVNSNGERPLKYWHMNNESMIFDANVARIDYIDGKWSSYNFRIVNKDGSTQDFTLRHVAMFYETPYFEK